MSAYNPYASGHTQQGDSMQQIDMPTNGQIMAGHSLDDIVSRNATLMRRQSMPQGFHPGQQQQQQQQQQSQQSQQSQPMDTDDPRRMSMMEFTGTSPTGPLESYQFSIPNSEMVDATAYMAASQANPAMLSRQSSAGGPDMAIDNGFAPPTSFMPMMPPTSSFQSPAHLSNMDMDLNSPYINTPMHMSSIGYNSPNIDRPALMYSHNSYHGMMTSPHHTSVPSHLYAQSSDASGNPPPPKRPSLENSHSRSSNSQIVKDSILLSKHSLKTLCLARVRTSAWIEVVTWTRKQVGHRTRQNIIRTIKALIGLHPKVCLIHSILVLISSSPLHRRMAIDNDGQTSYAFSVQERLFFDRV
jgi:hypothetical protein